MRHTPKLPFFSIACSLWLLSACVHSYRDRIDSDLSSWMQQPPDRLVESWGAPRSTYTMDDGRKVLTYEDSSFVSRTVSPYYFYPRPDVYSYSDSCKISFFTDATQKLLQNYSYVGSPGVCLDMIESGKATRRSAVPDAVSPTPPAPPPE